MGILRLTVKTKNGDDAYAGTVLFNSAYMEGLRLDGSDDSFFVYHEGDLDVIGDKYVVNETLTSADNIFTAANKTFYTLPVHDDVNDSSSATTSKVLDPNKIVKGVALASDASKSILWMEFVSGKVTKILVNQYLKAIYDYVMTGTTTTYA